MERVTGGAVETRYIPEWFCSMPLHKLQYYQKNQETLQVVENMIDLEPTPDSLYGSPRQATQHITASVFLSISPQPSLTASQGGWKRLMK